MMPRLLVHQIYYDDATRRALDPGFIPLDNSANERPDWREYWPIRRFLLSARLEDDALYGFLSPRFGEKTGLTAGRVAAFVAACKPAPDAVILAPHIGWDFSTMFLSVLEQGEHMHPGLMAAAQAAFDAIGLPVEAAGLVNDSRRAVFSNFLLARADFWRQWLGINEALFALAEDAASPVGALLRATTTYRAGAGPVAQKVFVMERIATLLLVRNPALTVASYPSDKVLAAAPVEALICDALKIALSVRSDARYRATFHHIRDLTLKRIPEAQRRPA